MTKTHTPRKPKNIAPVDLETGELLGQVKAEKRPKRPDADVLAEARTQELVVQSAERALDAARQDCKEKKEFLDSQIVVLRELIRDDKQQRFEFQAEAVDTGSDED